MVLIFSNHAEISDGSETDKLIQKHNSPETAAGAAIHPLNEV